MRFSQVMVFAAVAALTVGCGRDGKASGPGVTTQVVQRVYADLPPEAVLVSVNGKTFTKADMEKRIDLHTTILQMRKVAAERVKFARNRMLASGIGQFIGTTLVGEYGRASNSSITDEDRRPVREKMARSIRQRDTYDRFLNRFSAGERQLIGREIDEQVLLNRGRELLIGENLVPVTDKDIKRKHNELEEYNRKAVARTAEIYALATNTWRRIQGGETFEKVAERFRDDDHVTVDETTCGFKVSDYADDPCFVKYLKSTPVGCLTPPFEGDNGLMVFRMESIDPPSPETGMQEPVYNIYRVFFDLPETWDESDDGIIRAKLEKIARQTAFRTGYEKLVKGAEILYPSGTNLFNKAKGRERRSLPAQVSRRLPAGLKP